jgi:serine/threonine protein kinase
MLSGNLIVSKTLRLLEVFESTNHLLIVMEYAGGGDLLHLIKKKKKLAEDEAKDYFK